jgi:hypothetical protein
MLALGILLILLAIAAAVAVTINEPAASTTVTVFGRTFEVSATEMFILGLITAAVFLLGLWLLLKGLRRGRAKRKELRYARLEGRERVARLEEENRDLQRRLQGASPARETGTTAAPAAEPAPRRDRPATASRGTGRDTGYAEGRGEYAEGGEARARHAAPAGESAGEPAGEPAEGGRHKGYLDRLVDRIVSGGRHHERASRR